MKKKKKKKKKKRILDKSSPAVCQETVLQKICRLFQGFKISQELCLNFCVFDQSFGQWMRERQQQELLLPHLFFLSKFEGVGQVYWIYRLASEKPVEQRRKIQ